MDQKLWAPVCTSIGLAMTVTKVEERKISLISGAVSPNPTIGFGSILDMLSTGRLCTI